MEKDLGKTVDTQSPLISVVIPTHNRAELLKRAVRSVLGQTYRNLEIIVVDDASSDNTQVAVESFGDNRIRYIRHQTNRGGAAARNTGIQVARGDFIAFLDDDDEWVPEKTEEQLKLLRAYDMVMCTSNLNTDDLRKLEHVKEVSLDALREARFTSGGTGILMVRAGIVKELLFDESLPRGQDWDLFIRLAQRHTIGYLNMRLVRYNEGQHARISNRIKNVAIEEIEKRSIVLEKHKEFFGRRWYGRHMAGWLLYGIKDRDNKWLYIKYAIGKCGIGAVIYVLVKRVQQKLAERRNVS